MIAKMQRKLVSFIVIFVIGVIGVQGNAIAQKATCESVLEKFNTQDTNGFFPIYRADGRDSFIIGIPKTNPDQDYILSSYIDRGVSGLVGQYFEPLIIRFVKNDRKLIAYSQITDLKYQSGTPLEKASKNSLSDSRILEIGLVNCEDELYHYANISKSTLRSISALALGAVGHYVDGVSFSNDDIKLSALKSYTDNINFSVNLELRSNNGSRDAAYGSRFKSKITHTILKLPESGLKPRLADPSVGYFTVNQFDASRLVQLESDRFIQRWRLEKKDPTAAISEPVKPITFWIENTTPYLFREPISKGVLAWNEAFEAAGYSNAIEVKIQPDDATWEAGDINYNVIRWQASPYFRARIGYGPAISNPRTGEILSANVFLNFAGFSQLLGPWLGVSGHQWRDEIPSPLGEGQEDIDKTDTDITFAPAGGNWALRSEHLFARQQQSGEQDLIGRNKIYSVAHLEKPVSAELAGLVKLNSLVAATAGRSNYQETDSEKILSIFSKNENKAALIQTNVNDEVAAGDNGLEAESARMISEVITDITMHEIGHVLGLTHNFSGSRYRSYKDIHNREKTAGILSASVMDYSPINFAPPGKKQGDFANTKVGPYDIWAIRFGYDESADEESDQRAAILKQATLPGHDYAISSNDVKAQTLDLTDDPVAYAMDTIKIVDRLLDNSEVWSKKETSNVNYNIYSTVSELKALSVSVITAQLYPFQIVVDDSFERAGVNRLITGFNTSAVQNDALDALAESVFSVDEWKLPSNLRKRLGVRGRGASILDASQQSVSTDTLAGLLHMGLLYNLALATRQGADTITLDEYLEKLRSMVFRNDLGPAGTPSPARQVLQYKYVFMLTAMTPLDGSTIEDAYMENSTLLTVRRALEKERETLKRNLFLSYFWLPEDVKAHRVALRNLLK